MKERWFGIVVFILTFTGMMMVLSSSYVKALEKCGDGYFYFKKQLFFAGLGMVLMVLASRVKPEIYFKTAYIFAGAMLGVLAMVFLPGIGVKLNGSYRWIRIGGWTLQPSEYMKVAIALFLARFFSSTSLRGLWRTLVPITFYFPAGLLLLKEPDIGTALFLFSVVMVGCFVGNVPIKHLLLILVLMGFGGGYFVMKNKGERLDRIKAFIDPEKYRNEEGFQILQSLYAIGAGGIFGLGPGNGRSKLHYLPEPFTDYIFSVIAEEFGLIGVILIFFLFTAFFLLGFRLSLSARDPFCVYGAFLLTFLVSFQALIHMAVTLAVLPPKGITLPFVSYGGNSLLSSFLAAGIILSLGGRDGR